MVDVFISYSRTDLAAVTRLAEAVEAEGYDVWWDADLPPHLSYGDVITAKIGMAKAAIVVWSRESATSEWVRAEADMARNQKKLVQTALDNVMPPLPFNQIQYAEIGDWQGEPDHPGWRKVKVSLAELCGRGAEPAPRAEPQAVGRTPVVPPPPVSPASRWPLYAGVAIGGIALLAAGWVLMREPTVEGDLTEERLLQPTAAASSVQPEPPEQAAPVEATDVAAATAPGIEILPFSSDRLLTAADIAPLGPSTLRLARNEIYARHGRRFRDPELTRWFEQFSWYDPTSFEVSISPVEQQNVALLQAAEARFGQ